MMMDNLLTGILKGDHFHVEGPVKRWFIKDELIKKMLRHSAHAWLPIFERRIPKLGHPDHANTLFHLAGHVLKDAGADFVRKHWEKWSEATFRGLTFAALRCLPPEEAYERVAGKLDRMDREERLICKFVLGWLESPRVLAWIEKNVEPPIDVSWGALAARSQFDWAHLEKWLAMGRPISLVALDALNFCLTTQEAPDGHRYKPLVNPPSNDAIKHALEIYQAADPAVRVERTIGFLMYHLNPA